MTRFTRRAGALASAAILATYAFGTAESDAFAQDQAEPAMLETVEPAPAQPPVRFVASPVVQELPAQSDPAPAALPAPAPEASSLNELVATMALPGDMSRELHCLAQAVYFESRGEPLAGQLAVAQVVVNRAQSAQFPDDYCGVVTQHAQFSFVRGGTIPAPNAGSQAWQRARAIARIAHRELWESEAGDSLYFHAAHVSPRWAARMSRRASISRHVFYR